MVSWLSMSSGLKPDRSLHSNGLLTTLSQHYFLFLGTLSAHPQGVKLLEKCGLFQWWLKRRYSLMTIVTLLHTLMWHSVNWVLLMIFCSLLNLCSVKNQDVVLKLAVATLDYSRDGLARVILSKILTAATDVRHNTQWEIKCFHNLVTSLRLNLTLLHKNIWTQLTLIIQYFSTILYTYFCVNGSVNLDIVILHDWVK